MEATPTVHEPIATEQNATPEFWKLNEFSASRREDIERFFEHMTISGISKVTIKSYVNALKNFGTHGKPYRELTKEDMIKWMHWLEEKYQAKHTKIDYRRRMKRFFRWLHNGDDYEKPLPESVQCIKVGKVRRSLGVEILTEQEVKAIVEACETQRDRAMLFALYDSGCRAGELLSLRIKNVELDRHGAVLRVRGKTGERRIRIVASVPDLQLWLSMHPNTNDPNAPLWPRARELDKTISATQLGHIVRKYARKARVNKRVHPHVFRHSRATHLAKVLTEAQMRVYFGWTKASEIPSVYVHLSGRDVDAALLKHYGVESEEPDEPKPLTPKACPRCGFSNSPSARFCGRCSATLDIKAAVELDDLRDITDDVVARVMQEFIRRAPDLVREIVKQPEIAAEIAEFRKAGFSNEWGEHLKIVRP